MGEFIRISSSNELVLYDSVKEVVIPTQHRMDTLLIDENVAILNSFSSVG